MNQNEKNLALFTLSLLSESSTLPPCLGVVRPARGYQHGGKKKFNYWRKTARLAQGIQPSKATIKDFRIRMNIDAGRIVFGQSFSRRVISTVGVRIFRVPFKF